jgi:hypothetical protein
MNEAPKATAFESLEADLMLRTDYSQTRTLRTAQP